MYEFDWEERDVGLYLDSTAVRGSERGQMGQLGLLPCGACEDTAEIHDAIDGHGS